MLDRLSVAMSTYQVASITYVRNGKWVTGAVRSGGRVKPWEENWRINGRYADHAVKIGDSPTTGIGRFSDDARAQLAVQAPAMARLLRDVLGGRIYEEEIRAVLLKAGVDAT